MICYYSFKLIKHIGFLRKWNPEQAHFDRKEGIEGEVSEHDFAYGGQRLGAVELCSSEF